MDQGKVKLFCHIMYIALFIITKIDIRVFVRVQMYECFFKQKFYVNNYYFGLKLERLLLKFTLKHTIL